MKKELIKGEIKMFETLEETIGEYLYDVEIWNDFLGIAPEPETVTI